MDVLAKTVAKKTMDPYDSKANAQDFSPKTSAYSIG
jgi:hypothetical protein